MKAKMRKSLVLLLVMLTATALCGCKGGKENTGSSDNDSTPVYGGSVVVGIQQDVDSLDPHLATAAGTKEILFNVFEGLVKPDSNGNMVCAVASKYEISLDGLTYTFTLRDGIKFHNGIEVTVEDIKYSLDRAAGLLNEGDAPLISALTKISRVEIVDEKTVNVVLNSADSEMIYYFNAAIIPKDSDKSGTLVGTGPFKLSSYNAQESVVLEKNEHYWVAGVPYLDKVTFKIVSDTDSAMLFLQGGSIDIYPYLTADQTKELGGELEVINNATDTIQALFLNNAVAPLDNVKVRQAICYAVDANQINDVVFDSLGQVVSSSMIPGLSDYYVDLTSKYSRNIERAKELLKEAGYENGFTLKVTYPSNYQVHADAATIIADQLKDIGITVKLDPVDWNTWLKDIYNGRQYEATVCAITSQLAPSYLMSRYVSDSSKNFINYNNSKYDEVFAKASNTVDKSVKVEAYKELQQLLVDDAATKFLDVAPIIVAKKKKVKGYTFYPVYVQDMSTVYVTK